MLKSATHIERDLQTILNRHGYQSNSRTEGDNYINIGVNWGYVTAQLSEAMDAGTVVALVTVLTLIIVTGYLIIYKVFQISISNDIRSYGLLKTIGTTGKQKGYVLVLFVPIYNHADYHYGSDLQLTWYCGTACCLSIYRKEVYCGAFTGSGMF